MDLTQAIRARGVAAALAGITALAGFATTAQAQEGYGRSSRTRGAGGARFVLGTEVFGESRGIIYSDFEISIVGSGAVPTVDETTVEHDNEHTVSHYGTCISGNVLIDGEMPIRLGVRLGSFVGKLQTLSENPGGDRSVTDIATRPGLLVGIVADIEVPLGPQMFINGTFDFYFGMARIHNTPNPFGGGTLEGDYQLLLPELTGRFGYRVPNSGVAPFIGLAFSFFQGDILLEDADATTGNFEEMTGTFGNWSWLRVVLGVQFDGDPLMTRFQIMIWNPGRDFGAALSATFAF